MELLEEFSVKNPRIDPGAGVLKMKNYGARHLIILHS
jgi:hypothetical protein